MVENQDQKKKENLIREKEKKQQKDLSMMDPISILKMVAKQDLEEGGDKSDISGYLSKMMASFDSDDEYDKREERQVTMIPDIIEQESTPIKTKKLQIANFTNEQSLIKQACLFPSFLLIQQFADDLHLHEKIKNPLSNVIKK